MLFMSDDFFTKNPARRRMSPVTKKLQDVQGATVVDELASLYLWGYSGSYHNYQRN
jgi:hypothetical protein